MGEKREHNENKVVLNTKSANGTDEEREVALVCYPLMHKFNWT